MGSCCRQGQLYSKRRDNVKSQREPAMNSGTAPGRQTALAKYTFQEESARQNVQETNKIGCDSITQAKA